MIDTADLNSNFWFFLNMKFNKKNIPKRSLTPHSAWVERGGVFKCRHPQCYFIYILAVFCILTCVCLDLPSNHFYAIKQ